MKKANVIWILVMAVASMTSCFVQKKDRCPQVGQAKPGLVEHK